MELADSIVYTQAGFVRYGDAHVGLLTHGLNYGTGCFEGIRGYWNADDRELYLLHLREHYRRMELSARVLLMKLPHTVEELVDITVELCARNRFEHNLYIRPLLYKSAEDIGVRLLHVPDGFAIVAVPFDAYFDSSAGLKTCVSSWRRPDDNSVPAMAKATGKYVNAALAKSEAQLNGFDEAIVLSQSGHVSEGSAANIFMVRDGALHTPDMTQSILEGITRGAVSTIARDLGIAVHERPFDRSELYAADELFLTGSAAGVTFISSVDHRPIGDGTLGPITRRIADAFDRAVHGKNPLYRSWLTPTYANRNVTA